MTQHVITGDCLDVMAAMPGGSVDLCVTDPPYGMNFRSNRRPAWDRAHHIENDGDFDSTFQLAWMQQVYRLLKDDTHFYTFCSDHHLGKFQDTARAAGFTVKRTLVWLKNAGGTGDLHGDYSHWTEFILYCHKGRRDLVGQRTSNVLHVAKIPPGQMRHPTEKPVGIVRPLIAKSSTPGEVVLDPFAGSGTTAVAAREEGRGYVVIEQKPEYVDVIDGRLAQGNLFA